ncbi:MAG: DinB family protein [Gemmatimonadaceae bacterium]
MMTSHLVRLYKHLEWADGRVLASLRRSASPPPESSNVYAHLIAAEHVWLSRIGGLKQRVALWPEMSLDDCADLAKKNTHGFSMVLRDASASRLAELITYRNTAGVEFATALDDILIHVALHGMYHRGQIATSLRKAGSVPIPTDYIAFAREIAAPSGEIRGAD